MTHFYTRTGAAYAIAIQLHPDDEALRADTTRYYEAKLFHELCDGRIFGHYADTRDRIEHPNMRLPVEYRNLAGAIALGSALISKADLNVWLAARGIGISLDGDGDAKPAGIRTVREMAPSPERDAAMLEAHERYKASKVKNCLERVAQEFGVSRSTARDRLRIARANPNRALPAQKDVWPREFQKLITYQGGQ
ncbi:TPA: hypothetical protein ACK3RK_005424 [Burkholderia cepacia]